jgi:hypothetical protein
LQNLSWRKSTETEAPILNSYELGQPSSNYYMTEESKTTLSALC